MDRGTMYISRSDWKEFVERLQNAERDSKNNAYLVLKYQQELDRANEKVNVLAAKSAKWQGRYEDVVSDIRAALEASWNDSE